jgi:hypothetical protein
VDASSGDIEKWDVENAQVGPVGSTGAGDHLSLREISVGGSMFWFTRKKLSGS